MRLFRLWFSALFSVGWLAPFVLAWSSVLSYLNDDLALLHLATPRPLQPATLVINEALNITHAREMLYVAAGWLALVIFGWTLYALRRPAEVQRAAVQSVLTTLAPAVADSDVAAAVEPLAAVSADIDGRMAGRLQQLDEQLARLGGLIAQADAERREAPAPQPAPAVDEDMRADLKALIGQRLRTLDERFDSMVSLIAQADAARAAQVAELVSAAAAAAVAAVPVPAPAPVADQTVRADLDNLLKMQFEGLRGQLRENDSSLEQRLVALQSALERVQTAAAEPASTDVIAQTVAANDAKRLKQVVLNLADLQADLRMLRRKQSNG
jgi:hypothetical protein